MQKKRIAGIDVSVMALGAGGMGPVERDEDQFRIRDHYVDLGGNFMDTARKYANGACDEAIGRWMKRRGCRSRVVICAKGGFPADTEQMHISRLSPGEIREDLERSLSALGTDYADFYVLHRDDPRIPVDRIMPVLDALVGEGKARAVGCSNWTIGRIIEANAFANRNGLTPFVLSQMHHSLALTTPAQTKDLTHVTMNATEESWYRESGFPLMSFGAQGRGYFARRLAGEMQKPGGTLYYDWIPENHHRAERLRTLSRRIDRSPAAILAAYVRDCGLNTIVLGAFSSVEQMDDGFGALEFSLTPEQVSFLENGSPLTE